LIKKNSSILSILSIILAWHFLAFFNIVDANFFPSPFIVFSKMLSLFKQKEFQLDIEASLLRLSIGSLISIPLALISAILCSESKTLDRIINPFIAFTFPLPKVAIMPLLMLIFGIGDLFFKKIPPGRCC
jgi:ABC-type nitrate/sulfonate/bicarbonate transport system permease component